MDTPFEANENLQCGALTQDSHHQCTLMDGHLGRHIEHDKTTGEPLFGWRGDAYSAFAMTVSAAAPALASA